MPQPARSPVMAHRSSGVVAPFKTAATVSFPVIRIHPQIGISGRRPAFAQSVLICSGSRSEWSTYLTTSEGRGTRLTAFSLLHLSMHRWQSMHLSTSIVAVFSSISIAPAGQMGSHSLHPVHFVSSTCAKNCNLIIMEPLLIYCL